MGKTRYGYNCACNCHCKEWREVSGEEEHLDCGECFVALLEEEWDLQKMEGELCKLAYGWCGRQSRSE